ncbi:MAG: 50S ribosomal protein L25 [Deltaproteobacteria bacterium]|nr:50S ribosomal protein L25 [Deltaproteobacteria bacterium]
MKQVTLIARVREEKGKSAARNLRRKKEVPAVFYGPSREPVMLAVKQSDLRGVLRQSTSENILLELRIQGDGDRGSALAMLKELQTDPVKDVFLHADFYEISMDKELTIDVPIVLVNTPMGVTNGGILQHVKRELSVSGLPDKLIDTLEVDVSGLNIGDSLHIRDIQLPEGLRALEDENLTVAVVAAPSVTPGEEVEELEAEAEEAAEEEGGETEARQDSGDQS